jgi:hypothetical protein
MIVWRTSWATDVEVGAEGGAEGGGINSVRYVVGCITTSDVREAGGWSAGVGGDAVLGLGLRQGRLQRAA